MARSIRKASGIVWLRRCIQALCLLLFFYLFLQTAYHPINRTGGPVTLFFELDPLVLVATLLAGATIPLALLLSLGTLGVSVLFGRWFCGWVCPFGTLHQMMTQLRGGSLPTRLKKTEYSPRQRWKYLILIGLLAGTLTGLNLVGWFDPFSLLYRSLATAVFPALNSGLHALFAWLYENDPGVGSVRVTSVAVCPGGANPDNPWDLSDAWKPAECFFCWNCKAVCPKQAISFEFAVPSREHS